jgi:hypothetical protein
MEPVITGPSFLGLNTPAAGTGRAGVRDRNPEGHREGGHDVLRPSSSVDYLLEDEEEPRGGWGKWIVLVVALALAVGFGYLHWKGGGFEWVNGGDKKRAAATAQAPDSGQSGADSGGTEAAGGAAPQAGARVAGNDPAASPAAGGAQTTASQTSSQGTDSQGAPAPSAPAQTAASQSAEQASAPQSDAGDSSAPGAGAQAGSADSDKSPAVVTPRAIARKPAAAKPSAAKPAAAKPVDAVTEAERYIYGRGVAQDCDRGLRLLKPAAEQSNVKGMISLGALYSSGTCTPRDLPTAYRWFALALHKEPDNQVLQTDLQSLWSKMTPPERQLAIKLSQ